MNKRSCCYGDCKNKAQWFFNNPVGSSLSLCTEHLEEMEDFLVEEGMLGRVSNIKIGDWYESLWIEKKKDKMSEMIGEEDTGSGNYTDSGNYNFIQIDPMVPLGWKCPICGRVWSPSFQGPCWCYSYKDSYTVTTSDYGEGTMDAEEKVGRNE